MGDSRLANGGGIGFVADQPANFIVQDEEFMNPALYLEMSAEASRDPQIAQALAESDQATRDELASWLRKIVRADGRPPDAQDVGARALILQCLFEGLVVRAVREPKLDPALMARGLAQFIPHLQKGGST